MNKPLLFVLLSAVSVTPLAAQTAPLRPDQTEFRSLYKELVETDTTLSAAQRGEGSCTLAATRMAARLKAAGMAESQLTLFADPAHPNEGGLVAVYPGTSKTLKPMLMLAHIDVVEARRADWTRDPFVLIEENGNFYGRGTIDDKAQGAIYTDTLVRFAKAGYKPKRTVKLALTCGEETNGAFNGANYVVTKLRDLVDAEFAINEGGGGRTDGKGKLLVQTLQVGEKVFQNYRIEATNVGGHSSAPIRDNAIYQLSDALGKLREFDFPMEMSDVTRQFFAKAGKARGGEVGAAMIKLAANPQDAAAEAIVNTDKGMRSTLRTTCVATLLDGGHATNALPQRAGANVNCRIFPGHTPEEIRGELERVIGDPKMTITITPPTVPLAKAPPLDPRIVGPVEKLAAKYFPGVPVIPAMSTGATDAIYLAGVGIPTYGVPSVWGDPDGNGTHGLNERVEARALYTARDYLYDLVKAIAG